MYNRTSDKTSNRYNYKYGKLENGALVYAPNKLVIGTEQIFNAPAELYKSQGYLRIVNTEMPEYEEGFYYTSYYIEVIDALVQKWEKHEVSNEVTEIDLS